MKDLTSLLCFIFKFLLLLIYGTILIHIPSKLAVSSCLILVNYLLIRFVILHVFLNFFQLTTAGTCAFLIGKVFLYSVSILYILLVFWWSDYVRISLHDICRRIIFIWDAIWTYFKLNYVFMKGTHVCSYKAAAFWSLLVSKQKSLAKSKALKSE